MKTLLFTLLLLTASLANAATLPIPGLKTFTNDYRPGVTNWLTNVTIGRVVVKGIARSVELPPLPPGFGAKPTTKTLARTLGGGSVISGSQVTNVLVATNLDFFTCAGQQDCIPYDRETAEGTQRGGIGVRFGFVATATSSNAEWVATFYPAPEDQGVFVSWFYPSAQRPRERYWIAKEFTPDAAAFVPAGAGSVGSIVVNPKFAGSVRAWAKKKK